MKISPDTQQLELPHLPPPMTANRAKEVRRMADQCRYCHSCHMNVSDFIACREANT